MGRKVQLKNNKGEKSYPVTKSSCVDMSDGSGSLDIKLSELANRTRFPYDNKYAPTTETINNGAATMLIDGYLNIKYEDGMSYSFAIYDQPSNEIRLYKKQKDINPSTGDQVERIGDFQLNQIDGSDYYIALPTGTLAPNMFDSWFIVKKPQKTFYNAYDINGCSLSPKIFKGGINSNIILNEKVEQIKTVALANKKAIVENTAEIKSLSESFEEKETIFKNWSSPLKVGNELSTFSGWGMIIGTNIYVSSVKIKVKNRSEETMTKIRFKFFKDTYTGDVIVQKDVSVSIPAGESQDVECTLDSQIYYDKSIYLVYLCDKLCSSYNPILADTMAFYEKYTPADDVSFPKLTYVTDGDLDGVPFAVYIFSYGYVFGITIKSIAKILNKEISDSIKNDIKEEIIPEIDDKINAGLEVNLPDKIYATVDDTLQLFYRGIIKAVNPYIYDILVACQKGKQRPRYFEYTPTASDIGEVDFSLSVRNIDGTILATKTCKLVTVAKGVEPSKAVSIAIFGDSLTAPGTWCRELDRRLTGTEGTPAGLNLKNIKFVGLMKNNTTGYFGVGGWSWSNYITAGSPAYRFQVTGVSTVSYGDEYTNNGNTFKVIEVNVTGGSGNILCSVNKLTPNPELSGVLTKSKGNGDATITYSSVAQDSQNPLWDYGENKMTFIPYVNNHCNGELDCVITLLSWNGLTPHLNNFTEIINEVKVFADTLHKEYPNCKLKLCGIQAPSLNGGMGSNYGATGTSYADAYGMFVTALNMNKAYQEFANMAEYKGFVEFVHISSQFDSEYNMPYEEKAVNTRNSNKKEIIGTNGVHPDTPGAYQISDANYRNIIASFCQASNIPQDTHPEKQETEE